MVEPSGSPSRTTRYESADEDLLSAHKQADALRQSEERYGLAMEAASDGHMDWNLVTGEFYISPRMLKMVGHPPDATFVDRADWVRRFPFHPEDRPRWEAAIAAHFAGSEAKFNRDFRIVVNGETRWLAFNFIATRDVAGNVLRWTGSVADINDRKRDLATVLDAIPGMVALLSPTAEVEAVNNELLAYLGQPLEVIKQWGTNGIVLPEDVPRAAAVLMQAMSTGQPYETEVRIRRFDGVYRWNSTRGLPFLDSSGGIVRWYAMISDIDDRKRAENGLRESEQRYERAMLAAEAGFWDWDVAADDFYVSPKLLEMTDFPPGTRIAGRADFMARAPFHSGDLLKWESAVKELFASGGTRLAMEIRSIHGGETRWALLSGMCVRDAAGKILRWTGSATDVTARKRAEEALRQSEQRYERAMLASEAGFWDWDVATDKYYVSPKLLELIGLPAGTDFVGRTDFTTRGPWHPDDLANWERSVKELFASGGTRLTGEMRTILGAETRWYLLSGMCFRDSAGKVQRWTGSAKDITDQKRVEEALRESEQRYERVMLASEAGLWDWDVVHDIHYLSPQMLAMSGIPFDTTFHGREEFIQRTPLYPEDREKYQQAVRQLLVEGGTRLAMELRLLVNGETHWMNLVGMCFRDAEGRPLRWTGSASEITTQKRAQEALRLSEERYALAMEASEEGHLDWNVQTDAIFASEHLKQILGVPAGPEYRTREDMVSRIPVYAGDRERINQMTRDIVKGTALQNEFEFRVVRSQAQELRWIRARWKIFRDAQGIAQRVVGVFSDITESKRAEEKLRSRQEMLKLAQKAAGAVAFEWRAHAGKDENRWSPDLEALYGIPAGSYDGTEESLRKLIDPQDWPTLEAAIKSCLTSGDLDAEYRVIHPDGVIRWLQAKGQPLFDPDGKPARVVGFMFDVTDRHLAAEELRRMERQLRQARHLEALGTLAGGIAHDFNNLLGAILGYGEMALRNARAGTRLRRDIESIMIAGERGHALVERILAFSRSGVGERVAVHVERIARETLALFAAKLPRHIVIERRLHAGSAAVMGDPTQIHQVLMNLLTNAVQAMPSGGTLGVSLDRIHVQAPRVGTTGSIAPREYAVMEVSDSGTGIPAEILEKIFDPFFTTKEVGVGTGLGLSLVHGIVTGLGGAIDVATTLGKGSVFKVYLPLTGEVALPSKPRKRLETKTRQAGRGHILVIDDEEVLVRLATETLAELGYSPVGFTASAKALEAFLDNPEQFDAVITDEAMPGASGSELIRKMRTLRPTVPILLVSGYLSPAVIERAREAGATDVLKKPLLARDLQSALERVLSRPVP